MWPGMVVGSEVNLSSHWAVSVLEGLWQGWTLTLIIYFISVFEHFTTVFGDLC